MNQTDVCESQLTAATPEVCVSALSQKFASRGLVRSAIREAEELMEAEEHTRSMAPDAYRLSLLSEAAVAGLYRRGKNNMETADLIRYAEESRRLQRRQNPAEECVSIYETASQPPEAATKERPTALSVIKHVPRRLKRLPIRAAATLKERFPLWFDVKKADTSENTKKMPISAFAAIIAITVSLMLIVASALMITHTETKISKLNAEIATLNAEIGDMEAKLEAECDLMEIRRIAVEELGMVEESYLKMDYLSLETPEDIQAFSEKQSREMSFAAILSAIGWLK